MQEHFVGKQFCEEKDIERILELCGHFVQIFWNNLFKKRSDFILNSEDWHIYILCKLFCSQNS